MKIALEKVDFLRPDRITDDTDILTLKTLVFEPLLRWHAGGKVGPALFDRWASFDGGRRWTFTIRQDAKFHDGKPCTSEDVVAFIAAIVDGRDTFGMKWSYARYLASARLTAGPDDTVTVENPQPFADILDIFSEFYPCRLDAAGAPLLGTGPYRVAHFSAGEHALLERADRDSEPRHVHVCAIKDADRRYELLRAKEIDAAHHLEYRTLLETDDTLHWGSAANTLSIIAYLNCSTGLFASPEARLAVNHAIDKDRMIAEIFGGLAIPAASVVSPFHLGMAAAGLKPIPFDQGRAKALLDSSRTSSPIILRTPTFMPEHAPEVAAFIAQSLHDVGLEVAIDTEPNRPDYARQVARKEIGDMALFDSSPQSTYRVLDDKISGSTRALWWQGFQDRKSDELIATANRMVEPAAREQAYANCLRHLNANPPWLYLVHPIVQFACRKDIKILSVDHKGILNIA